MTSGVKPALPQMLMPKGAGDARTARARGQGADSGADFAEALGGSGAQARKAQASRTAQLESGSHPSWPHGLSTNLGRTADPAATAVSRLESTGEETDIANSETGDDDTVADAPAGETPPAPNVIRFSFAHPPMPVRTLADRQGNEGGQAAAEAQPVAGQLQAAPETHPAGKPEMPAMPQSADPLPEEVAPSLPRIGPAERKAETAPEKPAPVALAVTGDTAPARSATRPEPAGSRAEAPVSLTAPSRDDAETVDGAEPPMSESTKVAPRITVVAQQNIPAPMASTSVVLVDTLVSGNLLDASPSRAQLDAIHASATHASAQSLKIQLHPAELGMVTATLRFAGERLSIELQVENHEAYRRLSSDSEAIVASLRDRGYDIDRVTVLQPAQTVAAAAKADVGATLQPQQGRAEGQFGGSASAGGGDAGSGGRPSRQDGEPAYRGQQGHPARPDDPGGGLYI